MPVPALPGAAAPALLTSPFASPPPGRWFVSTGKDNLLNAWRTPYGASIFQVLGSGAQALQDTVCPGASGRLRWQLDRGASPGPPLTRRQPPKQGGQTSARGPCATLAHSLF